MKEYYLHLLAVHCNLTQFTYYYFDDNSDPATQAFMQVVNTPAKKARNTISDKSFLRDGAIAPSPANCIPIELGFANPHSAKNINSTV